MSTSDPPLDDRQLATLARVLEVILPSDSGAGARETDAIAYVRTRVTKVSEAVRRELRAALDEGADDPASLVARLSADRTQPQWLIFQQLRTWAWEGMLCDPVHGGNRGELGWRRFGVPGPAQPRGYRPAELALDVRIEPGDWTGS